MNPARWGTLLHNGVPGSPAESPPRAAKAIGAGGKTWSGVPGRSGKDLEAPDPPRQEQRLLKACRKPGSQGGAPRCRRRAWRAGRIALGAATLGAALAGLVPDAGAQVVPGQSAFLRPPTAPPPDQGNLPVRSLDPDIRRGVTVANRPRPEYDPQGITYGPLVVRPTLRLDGIYDDNILASGSRKEFDWIGLTTAGAEAASRWSTHELKLSGTVEDRRYARFDTENSTAWRVSGSGRYDISRFQAIDARFSAARIYLPRDEDDDLGSTRPVAVDEKLASLGYGVRENRVGLRVLGLYQSLRYPPTEIATAPGRVVPLDQAYRNRDLYLGSAGISYEIAPLRSAVLIARVNRRNYVEQPAGAGSPGGPLDRSSWGYEILGGLDSDYDGVFGFRVLAGWMQQLYADPRLPNPSVPSFDVQLQWNPTTLTSVRLLANRVVTESIRNDSSSIVRTAIGAELDHEWARNVLLNGGVGYRVLDYQGISRVDRVLSATVGASWLVNRNVRLGATYTRQEGDASEGSPDYSRNIFMLRLTGAL